MLEANSCRAAELLLDERVRTAAAYRPCRDPAGRTTEMEDSDIACLKRKYPFLADFSDAFICSTGLGEIMKMESTSIKIWEKERSKDCEERLANNKMVMASTVKSIPAGEDNRWSILHQGRFLAGAACLAAKLWTSAREVIGLGGLPAVACYDMASVGLGGGLSLPRVGSSSTTPPVPRSP